MSINLPQAVQDYFLADSDSDTDVALCFTENAIVIDERNTYNGQDAIRQWKADVANKFTYQVEPFACENINDRTVVSSKLTGSFPGSPVNLRYIFGLEGNKITYLEIKP